MFNCRFRKSGTENELNKDIVTPFRDDVQLTVNEYRAKIYEIMSTNKSSASGGATTTGQQKSQGTFRTKTKKFISASATKTSSSSSTANGAHVVVAAAANEADKGQQQQQRIRQLMENCTCPFERVAKSSSTTNVYKLEAANATKMRNKVGSSMPSVADAAHFKTAPRAVTTTHPPSNGVILPRGGHDVQVVPTRLVAGGSYNNTINNNNNNKNQKTERGRGVGLEGLPQRCYETRLKVLEEKIRRHKQEMNDFIRVGNNNSKFPPKQAEVNKQQGTQQAASLLMRNSSRLGLGSRIESKLSCSSSSSTSNQSLPTKGNHFQQSSHGSSGMDCRKPAFRCGCKPSSSAVVARKVVGGGGAGGGTNGKLFSKSPSSSMAGFGVISASDLYKLRSTEIISHN